jgi:hypothetical protein
LLCFFYRSIVCYAEPLGGISSITATHTIFFENKQVNVFKGASLGEPMNVDVLSKYCYAFVMAVPSLFDKIRAVPATIV